MAGARARGCPPLRGPPRRFRNCAVHVRSDNRRASDVGGGFLRALLSRANGAVELRPATLHPGYRPIVQRNPRAAATIAVGLLAARVGDRVAGVCLPDRRDAPTY